MIGPVRSWGIVADPLYRSPAVFVASVVGALVLLGLAAAAVGYAWSGIRS